jgi:hypothetical protein
MVRMHKLQWDTISFIMNIQVDYWHTSNAGKNKKLFWFLKLLAFRTQYFSIWSRFPATLIWYSLTSLNSVVMLGLLAYLGKWSLNSIRNRMRILLSSIIIVIKLVWKYSNSQKWCYPKLTTLLWLWYLFLIYGGQCYNDIINVDKSVVSHVWWHILAWYSAQNCGLLWCDSCVEKKV